MRLVDGIEIPEDFDGIDDDIALELMRENGLVGDQQEESEATSAGESTENESADEVDSEDDDSKSDQETAPDKSQDTDEETDTTTDDANTKTVPYQAMIAERNKRKALQAEIAALKAQYSATPPTQVQPPVTQPTATEEQTADQQEAYDAYIEKSAVEMFEKKYHREPDELSRTDNIILARYALKVEDGIQKYQEEERQKAEKAQSINQTYRQFVAEQQKRDEYEEIAADFVETVKALPADEQAVISMAYQQCETGKASPQDIYLLKKFWNEIASKHVQPPVTETKQPAKVVTPTKSAKTAEEKLSQIEKHPRTSLVTGTNSTKTTSIDEIAKLMHEMPWPEFEKKYPEYAKILLEG